LVITHKSITFYFVSQKWSMCRVQQHAIRENNAYKNEFLLLCSGVFVNKKMEFWEVN